jgi:hypothetical protein
VDDSTRGQLVVALTDALRRMVAEGDESGAKVVLRALEETIGLAMGNAAHRADAASDGSSASVADLDLARRKRPRGKPGG